jgi:homocysteine S-methyltransferase
MNVLDRLVAARGVAILDGGLATSLEAAGLDLDDPLWSARVLVDQPEAIVAVHAEHIAAGADIVITASYQASVPGLRARGLADAAAVEVLRRATALAREARDAHPRADGSRALVAASVGSYGAYRADRSEYRGDYDEVDDAALADFHRERLRIVSEGADLVACETIPCVREARVLADLLCEEDGPPAWVSLQARDDAHTARGEPIEAAVRAVEHAARVVAIGVNCIDPAHAEGLVRRIAAATSRLVVVYPNGAHGLHGPAVSPPAFAAAAARWHAAGARIIGGCCRTTAAHVAALAAWRGASC